MNWLDIKSCKADPFDQFADWYKLVMDSSIALPNAVALSTANINGKVSSRMVLLKNYDEQGFVFLTNYESRKGLQILENPQASLLFYWPLFSRQVRVEGVVEKISHGESDEYFGSRILGHRINALVSRQSSEIENLGQLVSSARKIADNLQGEPSRPEYWGGYRLVPDLFEFWQEGNNRFHDRFEYTRRKAGWGIRRLAP